MTNKVFTFQNTNNIFISIETDKYKLLENDKFNKLKTYFHTPHIVKDQFISLFKINTSLLSISEILQIIISYIETNNLYCINDNIINTCCFYSDENLSIVFNMNSSTIIYKYELPRLISLNLFK